MLSVLILFFLCMLICSSIGLSADIKRVFPNNPTEIQSAAILPSSYYVNSDTSEDDDTEEDDHLERAMLAFQESNNNGSDTETDLPDSIFDGFSDYASDKSEAFNQALYVSNRPEESTAAKRLREWIDKWIGDGPLTDLDNLAIDFLNTGVMPEALKLELEKRYPGVQIIEPNPSLKSSKKREDSTKLKEKDCPYPGVQIIELDPFPRSFKNSEEPKKLKEQNFPLARLIHHYSTANKFGPGKLDADLFEIFRTVLTININHVKRLRIYYSFPASHDRSLLYMNLLAYREEINDPQNKITIVSIVENFNIKFKTFIGRHPCFTNKTPKYDAEVINCFRENGVKYLEESGGIDDKMAVLWNYLSVDDLPPQELADYLAMYGKKAPEEILILPKPNSPNYRNLAIVIFYV